MSIEVTQIHKQYGEQAAISQVSFTINKGEIVGFLGPNGAGKSTTMKIITGYLKADTGSVKVCGLEVSANPIEVKKKLGYLPEANPLYADMYIREYLGFIAGVHGIKDSLEAIEKVITLTGLYLESKKKISQLSKGYKQRVGLAAALIHNPEVLILDEPTSGLDPNQIIEIRNVIKAQGKDKTVLFSSHILQEVEALCDRVIIINKGKLVADSTISNLQQGNKKLQAVMVAFKDALAMDLIDQVKGVTKMEQPQMNHYRFITEDPAYVRKQLLELAVLHNLNIVSLQTESQSLEDVFRSLTK